MIVLLSWSTTLEKMTDIISNNSNGNHGTSSPPSTQPFERVLLMTKGAGEEGYYSNSGAQADAVGKAVLPMLGTALERVVLPADGPVVVADLGCSSGENSISAVTFIVEKLRARLLDCASPTVPEFQVFFNDLPSNDFNNLFELLSTNEKKQDYFASGVAGSFFGRLFPRSSVHVFFSACAIQFLSKIPDAILDKRSPAYNKGKVWINGSSPAVAAAYKEQASSDFKNFLKAREAELIPGGLLFLFTLGRSNPEPNKQMEANKEAAVPSSLEAVMSSLNEACWSDLISEGVVTEEQRDNFNIPIYGRSLEEVKEAVESGGSAFEVVMTKLLCPNTSFARIFQTVEPEELSAKITGFTKAFSNSLLEEILGKEVANLYWQHFQKLVLKNEVPFAVARQDSQDWFPVLALIRK